MWRANDSAEPTVEAKPQGFRYANVRPAREDEGTRCALVGSASFPDLQRLTASTAGSKSVPRRMLVSGASPLRAAPGALQWTREAEAPWDRSMSRRSS